VQTFKEAVDIIQVYINNDVNNEPFYQSFNQDEENADVERLKMKIQNLRRSNAKFLFSFDNVDHLHKDNHNKFIDFLKQIVCSEIKVLFKSYKYLDSEICDEFMVKKIHNLKKSDAVDLFIKKIPLCKNDKESFFEWENIEDLHEKTVEKYGDDKDFSIPKLCADKRHNQFNSHTEQCIKTYLAKHPIFEILGGAPMVINIVAPMCVTKSLSEVFLYLAGKNQGSTSFSSKLS
jgi:hypothetical protein